MKVVCICQIYNELEKENLKRFFKHVLPAIDDIVIYDDCSTDGSYEYSLTKTPHVIRGYKNDFSDEMTHRQLMLQKALTLKPDFILWLDADEVLPPNSKRLLQKACQFCIDNELDGVNIHLFNIWRSAVWKRIDSLYDNGWFTRLWRVKPDLKFTKFDRGLHQLLVPPSVKKIANFEELPILHYGFSSEINLANKYLTYRAHGQRGYIMLDRLISEESLELEKVPKKYFPKELWIDEEKPSKLSFAQSLQYVQALKPFVSRPKYSIACLIYKSTDWLKFINEQVLKYTDLKDKEFYFVANDPTQEIEEYLVNNYIPHYIYRPPSKFKNDWYINNVYRAWNYAGSVARGDFIIFINSDMAFTNNWLENLIKSYNGKNCITSRLVESGKLKSGMYGIEKNFGRSYSNFKEDKFQLYAEALSRNVIKDSGLYMPLLIKKNDFLAVNGYPEGNIKKGSNPYDPEIATQKDDMISGDVVLMEKLANLGVKHQTSFNSITYHFQCGEMDEKTKIKNKNEKVEIAICNDLTTGTMGEKVLWDHLIEKLPGAYGVDKRIVGSTGSYEHKAKQFIEQMHPDTQIIIQNATFIKNIDRSKYTIVYLQDNLRAMNRKSSQQESVLKNANKIVTNSVHTTISYSDFDCEIIPIGVDHQLFTPKNKASLRKKHGFGKENIGIFVGNFSEVKGWTKIQECIIKHPKITWILVSKNQETYDRPNTKVYNRIDQQLLSELLNCADFFIIGSPVETQCLAAVEANFCNIPVLMPKVGIYKDFDDKDLEKLGIFTNDLINNVEVVLSSTFSPRQTILTKGLSVKDCTDRWIELIKDVLQKMDSKKFFIKEEDRLNNFHLFIFKLRRLYGTVENSITNILKKIRSTSARMLYLLLLKTKTLDLAKRLLKRLHSVHD